MRFDEAAQLRRSGIDSASSEFGTFLVAVDRGSSTGSRHLGDLKAKSAERPPKQRAVPREDKIHTVSVSVSVEVTTGVLVLVKVVVDGAASILDYV